MSDSPLTELYLVRHGETEWNAQGRLQNHLDSPLTELGRTQAIQVAKRLGRESFTALYCSDLGRAIATAEPISKACNLEIRTRVDLRELGMGLFEGMTWEEIETKYPEHHSRFKAEFEYVVPGAESQLEFFHRVAACLDDLAEKHRGERILAVTHGGTLAAAIRHVLDLPPDYPRRFRLLNTSINVFQNDGKLWKLRTWGDVSHFLEN